MTKGNSMDNLRYKLDKARSLYAKGGESREESIRLLRNIGWSLLIRKSTGAVSGAMSKNSPNRNAFEGYKLVP